jgi:hypothetical protein
VYIVGFPPCRVVDPTKCMVPIAFSVCTSYMIGTDVISISRHPHEEYR